MSAEAKPLAGGRDVVCGAFSGDLDEQRQTLEVFAVPRLEGTQTLKAFAVGGDDDFNGGVGLGFNGGTQSLHRGCGRGIAVGRKGETGRFCPTPFGGEGGMFTQRATESETNGGFGRSHKSEGVGVAVGAARKVAVETRHNAVPTKWVVSLAVPLSDAGSAGVGHDDCTCLFENLNQTVALGSCPDEFGAGIDEKFCFQRVTGIAQCLHDGGGTCQVLVGGVGARANQTCLHHGGYVILGNLLCHFADRRGGIGCERSVEVGSETAQVNFNHFVKEVCR